MIYLAVTLLVVGFLLRVWSVYTLKGSFTCTLFSPPKIVQTGPYRFVRHGSYTGTLLMLAGMSILSPILAVNWLGFMFFLSRICNEEKLLRQHPAYKEYSKKVGIFFPKKGAFKWDNT